MNFKQVELIKENKKQIAWIPENLAIVGMPVKLKEMKWETGWKVSCVYPNIKNDSDIQRSEQTLNDFNTTLGE